MSATRIHSKVTSLSWIPSEAVTGLNKAIFGTGFTHYDAPPPDRIDDLDALGGGDEPVRSGSDHDRLAARTCRSRGRHGDDRITRQVTGTTQPVRLRWWCWHDVEDAGRSPRSGDRRFVP